MPEDTQSAETENFEPQSWLSARTGLDRHPELRLQIDTIGHQIFTANGPQIAKSLLDLIGRLLGHIPTLHPVDHALIIDVAAAGLGKVLDAQGIAVDAPATPSIIGDIAAAVTDIAPKAAPVIELVSVIASEQAQAEADRKAALAAALEEAAPTDAETDAKTGETE